MTRSQHNGKTLGTTLLRKWVERASPPGADGKLLIIKYHRVENRPGLRPQCRSVRAFETQIGLLKHAFNCLTVAEAARRLKAGTLPERALCITFDDGYADNYNLALPILERYGLKATFFVTSGLLDHSSMWSDQIASVFTTAGDRAPEIRKYLADAGMPVEYPELVNKLKYMSVDAQETVVRGLSAFGNASDDLGKLMDADQIRSLAQRGMEVGGHTVNHTILTSIDNDQARREISECKTELESIIDAPVVSFAYPNGRRGLDYSDQHIEIVREAGFEAAVNTEFGLASSGNKVLELPRIAEYYVTPLRLFRVYL